MLLTILKDPFVYSMCFYIISAFSLPIHIFGGYCILYKTPVIMKSVKWALFNLHFWSAALDISISLFVQPYQCTPALAGFSMGLWGWMGVPPPIWTLIHFVIFRCEFIFLKIVNENNPVLIYYGNIKFVAKTTVAAPVSIYGLDFLDFFFSNFL